MKPMNVALLSLAGMALASVAVYSSPSLSPTQPQAAPGVAPESASTQAPPPGSAAPALNVDPSRFSAGSKLLLEGRVGHARILEGAPGETYVLLEATSSSDAQATAIAPSNLALVIDRSGSMKGNRLKNAVRAAVAAVDNLGDGDVVSVVSFDTTPSVVVPATVTEPGARARVRSAIEGITLGGDTCISCGIEEGARQILQTSGKVNRMIVLSDGDATHGVRDVPGFQKIAEDARAQGMSVTTIGVDVSYNQKILAALAQASGGRHYFVEDNAALARVFQAEAETLRTTIASDVEASIDLKDGVELDRVFDRPFRKEGSRILISLGSFAPGDTKTVLLKVRVPSPSPGGDGSDRARVADVEMKYRDLAAGKQATCAGELGVTFVKDASGVSELDGLVRGRLSRSETAAALVRANELFEQGKPEDAQRLLDKHRTALESEAGAAAQAAPETRKEGLKKDFQGQSAALSNASSSYGASAEKAKGAAKPQETLEGRRAVRQTQEVANPYME